MKFKYFLNLFIILLFLTSNISYANDSKTYLLPRDIIGTPRIIQSFVYGNTALVFAEVHLSGETSGPMLLWIPNINAPEAFIVEDPENNSVSLFKDWEDKTSSHLHSIVPQTRKKQGELLDEVQNFVDDKGVASLDSLNSVEPWVLFHVGVGAYIRELILPIDGQSVLAVTPSSPNLFLVSVNPSNLIKDSVEFVSLSSDASLADPQIGSQKNKIEGLLKNQAMKVHTQASVSEQNLRVLFFETSGPSSYKEIMTLILTKIGDRWMGTAMEHYSRDANSLASMSRVSILDQHKFWFDPSSNQYSIDSSGLKSFTPGELAATELTSFNVLASITKIELGLAENGFYFKKKFYKPVSDLDESRYQLNYLAILQEQVPLFEAMTKLKGLVDVVDSHMDKFTDTTTVNSTPSNLFRAGSADLLPTSCNGILSSADETAVSSALRNGYITKPIDLFP